MRPRYCPSCAAQTKSLARFCHQCGSILPDLPPLPTAVPSRFGPRVVSAAASATAGPSHLAWIKVGSVLLHVLAVAVGVASFAMTCASAGRSSPRDFVPWFFGGWVVATGLFLVGQGLRDVGEREQARQPTLGRGSRGRFDRYG
jgi:hypothetical protein